MNHYIKALFYGLSVVLCFWVLFIVLTWQPAKTAQEPPIITVYDKPLLSAEQKQEVLQTDAVSFDVGNEHIVITHGARKALKGYL